jgi:hypothetical protein
MRSFKAGIAINLLGALAITVIIAVIYLIIFGTGSSKQYSPQMPKFQNTSAPLPATYSNVLIQSGGETTAHISSLAQNHTAAIRLFTVSYNGSLYVQPAGIVGSIAKVDSPLYLTESKYGSETKLYINATQLPILGEGEIAYINLTNGTFSCTNFNQSAISTKNFWKALLSNRSVSCVKSNSLAGVNLGKIALFNLSVFSDLGLQLQYQTEYQSTYRGVPCTYISGIITQNASNISSAGNGDFEMCESDTYYVPLSFEMYLGNNKAQVYVNQNETAIGNYSQQSYVQSLPGPVAG